MNVIAPTNVSTTAAGSNGAPNHGPDAVLSAPVHTGLPVGALASSET
ncbi:MAG: hypothetical protein J0L91_01275 [Burkholderiales bacterium]|nr:hypothetical protein [Burkholderiales bacterium]